MKNLITSLLILISTLSYSQIENGTYKFSGGEIIIENNYVIEKTKYTEDKYKITSRKKVGDEHQIVCKISDEIQLIISTTDIYSSGYFMYWCLYEDTYAASIGYWEYATPRVKKLRKNKEKIKKPSNGK